MAKARGLPVAAVRQLVAAHIEQPQFGFLGSAYINVLQLNEALAEPAMSGFEGGTRRAAAPKLPAPPVGQATAVARRISDARPQARVAVTGIITAAQTVTIGSSPVYRCTLTDGTGEIDVLFLGRTAVGGLTAGAMQRGRHGRDPRRAAGALEPALPATATRRRRDAYARRSRRSRTVWRRRSTTDPGGAWLTVGLTEPGGRGRSGPG